MTNRKYKEYIEITEKALDMIDIKAFLQQNRELRDIIWDIEDYVETNEISNLQEYMKQYPDVFGETDPYIFNYMDTYEFGEYCEKRYPNLTIQEEIIERYWIRWN